MTNDYKSLLLKYLTGNLTNDYDVSTMNPYYESVDYQTKPGSEGFPTGVSIQCLDGNGKPNGKTLYYTPFTSSLTLVDENMNVLFKYDAFSTGTEMNKFLAVDVDEEGNFYGIDYNANTGKYRFLLMNNLSEPTKMPSGSLQYRAVLRNSYFIQGYTNVDDVSPTMPVFLGKSKQSAIYYFAFCDSTGENIMPSTLTINVGMANEWKRLSDILVSYSNKLDFIVYFDSNETPHASYFIYDFYMYNKIYRYDAVGEDAPTPTELIDITYVESTLSQLIGSFTHYPHQIEYDIIALSTNEYYFLIRGYANYGSAYPCYQWVLLYRDGYRTFDYVWGSVGYKGAAGGANARVPLVQYKTNDNGDLSMYYRLIDNTTDTYDKLYFTFIPNNPEHTLPKKFFDIETDTTIYNVVASRILISSAFNLIKGIHQNGVYGEGTIKNTIVSLIYNNNNYNTESFEANGTDYRTLLPNQALLFNTNNDLIFARNLYNVKVYGNKSESTLNVPNNALNDVVIDKSKLISYNNNDIVEDTKDLEKNIYEDLYINYFNTLTMQDQNTTDYKDNVIGATRINQSANKVCDYEESQATKVKVNYSDGTSLTGGCSCTITNGVGTYEISVYVPSDKDIVSIEIQSNDGNTTYQTIVNDGTMERNKYYKILQDVKVV